ncbi:phage head closure protein [Clostridium sp. NSJ-6]|uniref:Phage head closure protein n=1 Tax=Clostridium hominis TaxID=2763036 RepID=A0ABR7DBU0_9CLOT|nr:phage head closure protein [Clostridium hominis]MBC5628875.1 phage head closure protein [Clostridium hominis]
MRLKINPGEFRHPIIIERCSNNEKEVDDDNIPIKRWEVLIKPRAKITNTTGKEFIALLGETSKVTTKFTIRAPRKIKISKKDRILHKGIYYNIKHLNNIMELDILLEIIGEVIE